MERILWEEEKLLVSHSIFQLEERGALFAAVEIYIFFLMPLFLQPGAGGPNLFR